MLIDIQSCEDGWRDGETLVQMDNNGLDIYMLLQDLS
jgi:hypothetical protein